MMSSRRVGVPLKRRLGLVTSYRTGGGRALWLHDEITDSSVGIPIYHTNRIRHLKR